MYVRGDGVKNRQEPIRKIINSEELVEVEEFKYLRSTICVTIEMDVKHIHSFNEGGGLWMRRGFGVPVDSQM